MKSIRIFVLLCLLAAVLLPLAAQSGANAAPVRVRMQTSVGTVVLELYPQKAPLTVVNFLSYVKNGAYDGTIFHRVIRNFMIQGGGMNPDLSRRPTLAPVRNEANNGLSNLKGTIAMARTNDPHSATSQFFINTVDNNFLDFTSETTNGWGYTVFGKVVEGLDVVLQIAAVRTGSRSGYQDVPVQNVVIQKMEVITN
ncbi:MAG: peptidyl-prolyl cis-trans isomerase [Spirochaetes bacterium]|nr:peptidyl-prolyl cis-trans isomerase [Spirochaetota bacterium]MBU0956217.1 peptidyl-prolyl cis-trans isomerase [Spirochaetota bacterium]